MSDCFGEQKPPYFVLRVINIKCNLLHNYLFKIIQLLPGQGPVNEFYNSEILHS